MIDEWLNSSIKWLNAQLEDAELEEAEPFIHTTDVPEEPVVYEPYIFDPSEEVPSSQHLKYYYLDDMQKKLYDQHTTDVPEKPVVYEPYVFNPSEEVPSSQHLKYYDLNDMQKELYNQLYTGIANLELQIEIDPYWKADDTHEAFQAVWGILEYNNPEFFWYPKAWTWITFGNSSFSVFPKYWINGKTFFVETNNSGRFFYPDEFIYPSEEEVAEAKAWIEDSQAAIWDVINSLPIHDGMTPFELEVAVDDWLYDNVEYDTSVLNNSNIYGLFVEGRAVCEGYSKAFEYIMRLTGIECLIYIGYVGEVSDIGHAWNAVKLDGEWYQVDVTSDSAGKPGLRHHVWFNRNDEFMARDHIVTEENSLLYNPRIVCTATEYDYYRKTGAYITSDGEFADKVPGIIAKSRADGAPIFELEFSPDWAAASEIIDKMELIDKKYRSDIQFFWIEDTNIAYGKFN
jgi:transglutaminase-like putative cysteine protease